jgi:NAD-dependent SIR2 family protein deacetylase
MMPINELKRFLKEAHYIVVMTGAGMSVPSGIPDFRSAQGLYNKRENAISPEEILHKRYRTELINRNKIMIFNALEHKPFLLASKETI